MIPADPGAQPVKQIVFIDSTVFSDDFLAFPMQIFPQEHPGTSVEKDDKSVLDSRSGDVVTGEKQPFALGGNSNQNNTWTSGCC